MPTPSDRRSREGQVDHAGMRVIRLQIWIHHSSLQFPEAWSASWFLFFLQGVAASICTSNFLLACLMVS